MLKRSGMVFVVLFSVFVLSVKQVGAENGRVTVSDLRINGQYGHDVTSIQSNKAFVLSAKVANTYGFKQQIVVFFQIVDSGGATLYLQPKEVVLGANEDRSVWSVAQLNSTGVHTASIIITDTAKPPRILNDSVEKMQFYQTSPAPLREPQGSLYDDFSGEEYTSGNYQVSPNGKWYHYYSGSRANPGKQGVKASATSPGNVFFQDTPSPTSVDQTYSTLTLSTASYKNFEMSMDVRTAAQTRINSPPKPWEVAWVFWHAVGQGTEPVDRTHFYYFVVKTNGVEIGKYDGGTNPASQKIIANKYYPAETPINNKIGEWQNWKITVVGDHIVVRVNGAVVFDIYDSASFDSGRVGLYNEDAKTEYRNVAITPMS
ncbi:DUF1080 domain-containing protein, partial [Nitrososphaera sp.]|uniref:3-keto-disaccharide hydrolase n=1 Tax=Nitrososphaera sp. TaxID=1971748 RepID=UPI00307D9F4C